MSSRQTALKALSYWMFICAFVMLAVGMILFTFARDVIAVVMASLAAACIVFDVMLGVLGRGAAADPRKAAEMRGVIFTALVFNAASVLWFVLHNGMVAPVVGNAISVLVFAAAAHLVNKQA